MSDSVVHIGFDLGTSVTKMCVVSGAGTVVGSHSRETEWVNLGGGRAEQDPEDVVAAVEALLAQAAGELPAGVRISSIGFTSMAESGVLIDAVGRPHCPVIAWHDPRGSEQADRLGVGARPELADFADAFPAMTGLPVSHVATVFKLAWMRDHGYGLADRQWLSVPEYVIHRLGGRRVGELSLLGRTGLLDIHRNKPWLPAFDHLGVDPDLLPEIVGAGTPLGVIDDDHSVIAARGAVLTVAGHDHAVAAAAAGCGVAGSALDSFGTAEAFVAAADAVPDPDTVRQLVLNGVSVYPHVVRGATALIGGTRTGLVFKRVLEALGADDGPARSDLDRLALDTPFDAAADIDIAGYAMTDTEVTIRLRSDGHGPVDIWRATIDGGTAHGSALLDQLRNAGVGIERLVVAGGWTRMASVLASRQAMAPVVEVSELVQPGPFGAATIARWAAEQDDVETSPTAPVDHRPPATWFDDAARMAAMAPEVATPVVGAGPTPNPTDITPAQPAKETTQ